MKLACSPVTPVKASLAEVNEVKALRLLWSFRGLRARVADPPALRVPGKSNPSIREANGNGAKKSALPTLVHHQDKTSTRSPFSVALLWFVISIFQNKTEWSKTEVDHQGWSNLIMCQNWNPQPACTTRHNDGIVVPSMTLAAQQDLARHATRKVSLMSLTFFGSLSASSAVTPAHHKGDVSQIEEIETVWTHSHHVWKHWFVSTAW